MEGGVAEIMSHPFFNVFIVIYQFSIVCLFSGNWLGEFPRQAPSAHCAWHQVTNRHEQLWWVWWGIRHGTTRRARCSRVQRKSIFKATHWSKLYWYCSWHFFGKKNMFLQDTHTAGLMLWCPLLPQIFLKLGKSLESKCVVSFKLFHLPWRNQSSKMFSSKHRILLGFLSKNKSNDQP